MDSKEFRYKKTVLALSLLLIIMVIPHVLEDFAVGEPAKNGVPVLLLQGVVASLIAIQAFGLYNIGGNHRVGYFIQVGIGFIWPLLAGIAQLPTILTGNHYRSGFISVFFVFGVVIVGILLLTMSIFSLKLKLKNNQ